MIKHMKSHVQTDKLAPLFEGYIHYKAKKKRGENSLARGTWKIQQVQSCRTSLGWEPEGGQR